MESDLPPSAHDDLQFDRVEHASAKADAGATMVTCSSCNASINTAYYNVGSYPFCAECKGVLEAKLEPDKSLRALGLALLFGLGAAIAGAAVYYGVIAITSLEIGIVAILIGYMVGWAVHKGAGGRGARRFQVMAVALTYFSVGLAYLPLALKSLAENDGSPAAQTDSTEASPEKASTPAGATGEPVAGGDSTARAATGERVAAGDSSASPAAADVANTASGGPGFLLTIAVVTGLSFALPVLFIIGSMPGGLISALIILFGMLQAWRMTGAPQLQITGPFRVGPGGASSTT
jgi:hypothetical protein